MTECRALLLLLALLAASTLTGILLCAAVGRRQTGLAGLAFASIIGALAWTVATVHLSSWGVPAGPAAACVLAAHGVLLFFAWRRWRVRRVLPRSRRHSVSMDEVVLVAALVTTAILALLPLLLAGGYASSNDTCIYAALSEWLQVAGDGVAVQFDPIRPTSIHRLNFQSAPYQLAAGHILALAQVASGLTALVAYPATSALAMVLASLALFFVARYALGLSRGWAAVSTIAFALIPHPIYFGHHNGFLSQTWATAALLFLLGLLARIPRTVQWRAPEAVTVALALAFLYVVYLPFFPLGLAAVGGWLLMVLKRGRWQDRAPQALAFLGVVALSLGFLVLFDSDPLVKGLSFLSRVSVGWQVALQPWGFVEFGLGTRAIDFRSNTHSSLILEALRGPVTLAGLAVLPFGIALAARRPRAWPLGCVLATFFGGVVYQAVLRDDQWTGSRGNRWAVFKLLQWQFPLVLLVLALGGQGLLRWWRRRLHPRGRQAARPMFRLAVGVSLAFLAGAAFLPVHVSWSRFLAGTQAMLIDDDQPLVAIERLQAELAKLPPGGLLLLEEPGRRWFGIHLALLAWPRPVIGDWAGSAYMAEAAAVPGAYRRAVDQPPGTWISVACNGADLPGGEALGAGCRWWPSRPRVALLQVVNPGRWARQDDRGEGVLGGGRTKITVFARAAGPGRLCFRVVPPAHRDERTLRVYHAGGDLTRATIARAFESPPVYVGSIKANPTCIDLTLPAGRSLVVMTLGDGTSGRRLPIDDLTLEAIEPLAE